MQASPPSCSRRSSTGSTTVVGEVDGWWVDRDQLALVPDARATSDRTCMHGIAQSRAQGKHARAVRLLVGAYEFIDAWGPYAAFAELLRRSTQR